MVVGPPPTDDTGANARIGRLSAGLGEVCGASGVPFVSVVEPLLASSEWMEDLPDGAHPGAAGYAAFADVVLASGWLASS